MLLTKPQKEKLIVQMTTDLEKSKMVVLVNYQGLKVKEIQIFKKQLKEKQINFQIIKNSLLKIALKNAGINYDETLFDQPLAIIWGDDEVTPAKLAVEYQKTAEKLDIIGGILNQGFVEMATIDKLAKLPSREELYAQLVGSLNAPISRLVNVLQGNLGSLVYILSKYQESKS